MAKTSKIKEIKKIVKETESEIKNLKKTKDNALNADMVKTLKAQAYEKILSVIK